MQCGYVRAGGGLEILLGWLVALGFTSGLCSSCFAWCFRLRMYFVFLTAIVLVSLCVCVCVCLCVCLCEVQSQVRTLIARQPRCRFLLLTAALHMWQARMLDIAHWRDNIERFGRTNMLTLLRRLLLAWGRYVKDEHLKQCTLAQRALHLCNLTLSSSASTIPFYFQFWVDRVKYHVEEQEKFARMISRVNLSCLDSFFEAWQWRLVEEETCKAEEKEREQRRAEIRKIEDIVSSLSANVDNTGTHTETYVRLIDV